ncbi:Uncharacterised protein [Vibrio cholerae]|nr:Uncharacterised protein [Vibrio cholerae]
MRSVLPLRVKLTPSIAFSMMLLLLDKVATPSSTTIESCADCTSVMPP